MSSRIQKGRLLRRCFTDFVQTYQKNSQNNINLLEELYICTKCSKKNNGEFGQILKQNETGHKSDIKMNKTSRGLFKHIRDSPGHEINWENQVILVKEANMSEEGLKKKITLEHVIVAI